MKRKLITENLFNKLVDSFFDSYKRGLEDQFLNSIKRRDPELARQFKKANDILDDIQVKLDTLNREKNNRV